jgi:uncharacterized protein (TIGR02996 family)
VRSTSELLAAVLADPAADAPRAAYADALELEGDIRCELIRLQLAATAARRAGERPDAGGLRHAAQLLVANGARWAAEVQPLVDEVTFLRGFVDKVRLDARAFVERAERIYAVAPVLNVALTVVGGAIEALAASPALARLRSLCLARSGIDDAGVAALLASPHLGQLRWLDLSQNRLGVAAVEALCAARATLPWLTFVNLHKNTVSVPCDTPVVDYDGLPRWEAIDPGLQAELEARHGAQRWLHFRTAAPWFYPPTEDQLP